MDNVRIDPDAVAAACFDRFRRLPKRGKPQKGKEWTVLAGVLLESPSTAVPVTTTATHVVALGTGSKCEGCDTISVKGDQLFDSHAEVIARRAFVRYIYSEAEKVINAARGGMVHGGEGKHAAVSKVFELSSEEDAYPLRLRDGVRFHLFVSQAPCGDACIFPLELPAGKQRDEFERENFGIASLPSTTGGKRVREDDGEELENTDLSPNAKRPKVDASEDDGIDEHRTSDNEKHAKRQPPRPLIHAEGDIHRTGARCVPGGQQDRHEPLGSYHEAGILRTKPGRGNPTKSMSCSDKIALWTVVGLQGSLIASLAGPIYLHSVTIGRHYNSDALERALSLRLNAPLELPSGYTRHVPVILSTSCRFEHDRETAEAFARASQLPGAKKFPHIAGAASIGWWEGASEQEATTKGRIQGVTPSGIEWSARAMSMLCKTSLAALFNKTVTSLADVGKKPLLESSAAEAKTYLDLKRASSRYRSARDAVLAGPLCGWVGNSAVQHEAFEARLGEQ